jgi:hypothetical protein
MFTQPVSVNAKVKGPFAMESSSWAWRENQCNGALDRESKEGVSVSIELGYRQA